MKYGWIVLVAAAAYAQDTRNVTEPVIPRSCTVVAAKLSSGALDENRPDTQRIQEALDHCTGGQAVELKAEGAADAFLAGPLQLRQE